MAELKTRENDGNVLNFINSIENLHHKKDSLALLELMGNVTDKPAKMWGKNIIGFGKYHYRYDSGREGDWFMCGFSPRVQNMTIYIMKGFGQYDTFLQKLGKYKTGKSCLYINKLDDIDMEVLEALVRQSVKDIQAGAISLMD